MDDNLAASLVRPFPLAPVVVHPSEQVAYTNLRAHRRVDCEHASRWRWHIYNDFIDIDRDQRFALFHDVAIGQVPFG
jgi:hypothetical protein